jgi:hypothetical protein
MKLKTGRLLLHFHQKIVDHKLRYIEKGGRNKEQEDVKGNEIGCNCNKRK